jgi:hypothetical protein
MGALDAVPSRDHALLLPTGAAIGRCPVAAGPGCLCGRARGFRAFRTGMREDNVAVVCSEKLIDAQAAEQQRG